VIQALNIVGPKVKEIRSQTGMSQAELAGRLASLHGLQMDQSDISEIERRVRGVRDVEAAAIADCLGVSIQELFEPLHP
jgi:transcriptional regulator with XRE-family HTH domain